MSKLLEQIKIAPKNTKKIGDIVAYIADNRGKNPAYYSEVGIPVIDNFMITGHRAVDLSIARRFVDEETYKSFIRKETRENDILVTLVGNGYGQICLAPKEKSVIIQNTIGLRTDNLNSNFYLFYLLGKYKEKITALDRGAAQPSVKVGDLLDIDIHIPNLPIQNKIANILSAYDYKIENNNKIIKNLELTAQTIFNEWLVNFKFPGYQNVKMVENETGEIPEGWIFKSLDEVSDIIFGFNFKAKKFNMEKIGIPVVRIRDVLDGITNTFTPEIPSDEYKINIGDLLIGMDGTFHCSFWYTDGAYLNQRVVRIRSELPGYFIFESVRLQLDFLQRTITGATVGHLANGDIRNFKILIPKDISILKPFENITNKILTLKKEIISLESQRDQLLLELI